MTDLVVQFVGEYFYFIVGIIIIAFALAILIYIFLINPLPLIKEND